MPILDATDLENIANAVWDEPLTAATHNVPTSSGRRLRQVTSNVVFDGVVISSTTNTVSFDGDASSVDGAYDPAIISIVSGTGIGQTRMIYQYNGSTKTAILDRDWKVQPANGDECIIVSDAGREHVNEGQLQDGGINWVKLNQNASSSDNAYVGQIIFLRSGTGEDQACKVISYDGTTKVATVCTNFNTIPDATTGYVMLPTGMFDAEELVYKFWNYISRTLTETGNELDIKNIWEYDNRTLTYSPTNIMSLQGDGLSFVRGDSFEYVFSGIDLDLFDKAYFTIKKDYKNEDRESILSADSEVGLIYLNGWKKTVGTGVSITENVSAGTITVVIDASITKDIPYSDNTYYYDLQIINTDGTVVTPFMGEFSLIRDITRAVS